MQIVVSGLGEEPGWRGFALPRLQQRWGPLRATLLIGLLWGGWHLPLFLTDWSDPAGSVPVVCEFIFLTMASSIIITWVLNHTQGSILIAILLHATFDAFCSVSWPSLFATPLLHQNAFLGVDISYGIVALLLIVLTRGQLGYQKASPLEHINAVSEKE
jgi:membrane protease YdiL (CAAX protease family)